MNAQTIVREHRSHLLQLRRLADRDLAALLGVVNGLGVADVRDVLIEALPELLAPYTTASGELAAVLFEDLRVEAGRRGVFYAETASALPPRGRIEGTTRWAVGPLVPEPYTVETIGADGVPTLTRMMTEPNMLAVQSRLSGSLARMIMDASRETMQLNGAREQTVRFQRMARPGACAFCGMLASRPPYMSYKSSASAGEVVGRGSTRTGLDESGKRLSGGRGGGIKARGSRELKTEFHDDCRCVVMPIYEGTAMAHLARVERESWEKKYRQSLSDEAGNSLHDPKDILAEWRRYHGAK